VYIETHQRPADFFAESAVGTALEFLKHRERAVVLVEREDRRLVELPLGELEAAAQAGRADQPLRSLFPPEARLVPPEDAIWSSAHVTWMPADGILRILTREGELVTQANVREAFEAAAELVEAATCGILVDIRGMSRMSRDARNFFKARSGGLGVALLAAPGPSLMIANFFMGLKRGPRTPTRMFVSEAAAVHWLQHLERVTRGETG